MKSVGIGSSLRRGAVLTIAVVAMCSSLAQDRAANLASPPAEVAPLDYPVDKEALGNPWLIAAAGGWPSMSPEEISKCVLTPSPEEVKHFSEWVRGTIGEKWLPDSFQNVPYLTRTGFVHVRQNNDYLVRIREAEKPAYQGSLIITKAIVVAVQPVNGQIPIPKSPRQLLPFIAQFLHSHVVVNPEQVQFVTPTTTIVMPGSAELPAIYVERAEGTLISTWPTKCSLPIRPYAWTDGKVLLVALYEDVHYGEGPTPEPQVHPTPPPPLGEE